MSAASFSPLTRADRERLAKVCEMFASDYAGERSTAALQAHRIVSRSGDTWTALLAPALPPPAEARPDSAPPAAPSWMTWQQRAELCSEFGNRLTAWERDFIASIRGRSSLTWKQSRALDRIFQRVWGAL